MSQSNPSDLEPLNRTQILGVTGVTAIILLFISKLFLLLPRLLPDWGPISLLPVKFNTQACLYGAALAVLIIVASGVIYRLWPAYRESADAYLAFVIEPLVWPDLIWLGLLPGLSEELLFRGVILAALGLGGIAVVVSSCIFGVLHLSNAQQWPYVIWATTVGLALGFSAITTGNLLVPIIAHVLTNLVSSALWKYNHQAKVS